MNLALGPLVVELTCEDGSFPAAVEAIARTSRGSAPVQAFTHPLRCSLSIESGPRLAVDDFRESLHVDGEVGGGRWSVLNRRPAWTCEGSGLSSVRLVLRGREPGAALASFLKFLLSEVLVRTGGLAVHGAAVRRPGGAIVALAPSGGGKTTLVRTFGGHDTIGDDYSAFAPASDGWVVFPVPFSGREGTVAEAPAAPLRLIAELGKAEVPSWRPFGRAAAVSLIVHHALLYTRSLSVRTALLDTAGRLVRSVPAGRLGFNLVDPPWSCVDGRY